MRAQINISSAKAILVELDQPIQISIPIKNGPSNPNCYWAEPVKFETIEGDGFIGSVEKGGPVNYQKLSITPHGNGTHIEGYGHITDSGVTINKQLKAYHFYSLLITLTPTEAEGGDLILDLSEEMETLNWKDVKALIIRTTPNNKSKLTRNYSGTNPPYLSPLLVDFIVKKGINHLLVDLPSVDKEVDNGALLSHNSFWGLPKNIRKQSTITELIYVSNEIKDGNYLLNLQTVNLEMDAAPCQPILYKIEEFIAITHKK